MPKVNVYLPEELAAAVRAAGVPLSPVCQQALREAVRSVTVARKAIAAIRDPDFDPDAHPSLGDRLGDRSTVRLQEAMVLARRQAGAGPVESRHLLGGVLEHGDNLAVRLLQALEAEPDEVRAAMDGAAETEPPPLHPGAGRDTFLAGLTLPARRAVAAALESSIEFGHNYLGTEHLLLGLLADTDTLPTRILSGFGVEAEGVQRGVVAALAGFAAARATGTSRGPDQAGTSARERDELARRLGVVEERLAAAGL